MRLQPNLRHAALPLLLLTACANANGSSLFAADPVGVRPTPGPSTLAEGRAADARPPSGPLPVRTLRAQQPPLSGGTMARIDDGHLFVGDELTDQLFVVDSRRGQIVASRQLAEGAQPGRVVTDGEGYAHVVLRGAGEVLRVATSQWDLPIVASSRPCEEPRGIAYDRIAEHMHVVCAGGELVTMTLGHEPVETHQLDDDLRDVVAYPDRLFVSRFRSAEVLILDEARQVVRRVRPDDGELRGLRATPQVAWRMREHRGGVLLLHLQMVSEDVAQSALSTMPRPPNAYYASGRSGAPAVVMPQLTIVDPEGGTSLWETDVRRQGSSVVVDVAAYGASWTSTANGRRPDAMEVSVQPLSSRTFAVQLQHATTLLWIYPYGEEPIEVSRLEELRGFDPGREAFHALTGSSLACASCHPEAHEDGHTWVTPDSGARRTQSLLGGLSGTEPFHWAGDVRDFDAIMDTQAVRLRTEFDSDSRDAMLAWLDRLDAPRPPRLPTATEHDAFVDAGCAGCHSGDTLSDGLSHDLGSGAAQTPRLQGVLLRAPYFSEGCAQTLEQTLDGECRASEAHAVRDPELRARVVSYLRGL